MPPSFNQDIATPASMRAAFARLSVQNGISIILGTTITYFLSLAIYRLFFHPLAKVPGPRLSAVTDLPYLWQTHISGSFTRATPELHRKYGPVVRTGPDNVAVAGRHAWPEVFMHRKGKAEYQKSPGFFGETQEVQMIGATTEDHRRQRRHLAHAFSEAAMFEQEAIITQYVELLQDQMTILANKGETVDLVSWFNFTTFDIIGDLSFGDSFHCLDASGYHPWVQMIFSGVRGGSANRFLAKAPLLQPLMHALMPELRKDVGSNNQTMFFAVEKAKARMAQGESPGGRRDFMTYMMRKNRDGDRPITDHEIFANVPVLVTAGSETTATALSAFAFYMARSPAAYKKATEEVRSAFGSEAEINFVSSNKLSYLHACIEETMRMFPPAAETPPRTSPGDVVGGYWIPKGTSVSVYPWAVFRDPENFVDPESFIPERFLPRSHPDYQKRFERDNHSVFHPFSAGPRNCIGKSLAYAELRIITARFLYRFDYELEPGQDDWHNDMRIFVVWEKPPLMARLTVRETS